MMTISNNEKKTVMTCMCTSLGERDSDDDDDETKDYNKTITPNFCSITY